MQEFIASQKTHIYASSTFQCFLVYTFKETEWKYAWRENYDKKMFIYFSYDMLGDTPLPSCVLEVSLYFFGVELFKASNTPLALIQDFAGTPQLQNTQNCQMNHKLALEIFTAGINSKISSKNSISKRSVK